MKTRTVNMFCFIIHVTRVDPRRQRYYRSEGKLLSSGFIKICSLNFDEISSTLSDCAILVVFRYYKDICYSFISYILSVHEIEKSHTHKLLSGEKYRSEQLFFRGWRKA
jgi:hypothetical protein